MKILFTVEFYEPHKGGAEEVVKQLAERLVRKGHEVTVATTFLPERKLKGLNGVKIEDFALSGNAVNGIRGNAKEIERFRELLKGDFDVVVNYAAQIWTTDLAFPILSEIKAGKILVPCGYSGLKNPAYVEYFAKLPEYLAQYDRLIYMSEHYQDKTFGDEHGVGEKSVIISNGAAEEEFIAPDTFRVRERLGIKTPHLLLTVANHYRAKGHGFVIEAFLEAKRTDATLLIVGEKFVSSGLRKIYHFIFDFLRCWWSSLIHHNIVLVSGKNRRLVLSAYKSADLFVFGSEVECAPLVMYEAFASKTPFVSTPVGNIVDYAEYAAIVYSPSEMTREINKLLNNGEARNKMAERAFSLWKENYIWSAITDRYLTLFESLCQK